MRLVEGFQLLATAPDGVVRLREWILSLAVQGKLVPQDPNDEPATALLRQVRAQKDRLIGEGKIRRDKALPDYADEEKPFALPAGWEWARMQQIADARLGKMLDKAKNSGQPYPYLRNTNVQWHRLDLEDIKFINLEVHELEEYRLRSGDLLICEGGEPGRCAIWREQQREMYFQKALHRVRPLGGILPEYVALCLEIDAKSLRLKQYFTGATIKHFAGQELSRYCVPLPPLAEQSRIVAKVDELMQLCDELEIRGRLEEKQHAQLTAVLFETLATSESAHALAENWSRVAAHFDLLLDRPEAIDVLEQSILQLAVRGLLVPQDAAEEPASVLLEQVQAARDKLVAQGKVGRSTMPSASDDARAPKPIVGWESVTIPDLCVIGGGATPSKSKAAYWEGTLPWVSPKDMKVEFISDAQDHVSELALEETRLPLVPASSLLIVVRGMILAHSFPVGVTQVEVTINQDMKSLTPFMPALVPYLALVCRGFKREILSLVDRSTHGTCKLQSDKLFAFRFGLPPLAEQSRILARVETLRCLCTELRERLTARRTCQARFAETLVAMATSTAVSAENGDDLAAAA